MASERGNIDLVRQLLLEAGRIMEDGSPSLAMSLPSDREAIERRIATLANDARTLLALAQTAGRLIDRPTAPTVRAE